MEKKQSVLGIVGFILSLLGCTSFVGFILCIVALFVGKDNKKGFAIAGIIVGLVWCILITLLAIFGEHY